MTSNKTLLILPGDGIGTEVMREVRRVVDWFDKRRAVHFDITEGLVGGASIDADGTPISDATMERAMTADAVLMGAVGGPKWDSLPFAQKPERGLLRLRKDMELFANLRPALVFAPLVDASSLKPELVRGLDILIVRELTGGVYFGQPRGIETLPDGTRRGVNTQVYTTPEIIRVAKVAFDLARLRGNKVCSVEKANVMESGVLWREEVQKLHDSDYADVDLSHMYADNCAMQLVLWPRQFDVIVCDNTFGDILSDEASAIGCGLGLAPSATLGSHGAVYEPIHGTAPDIAGKGLANPVAAILTTAMLLRYTAGHEAAAGAVERAVASVLAAGARTADLVPRGEAHLSTAEMGSRIAAAVATA